MPLIKFDQTHVASRFKVDASEYISFCIAMHPFTWVNFTPIYLCIGMHRNEKFMHHNSK
ncbi:hypothetical protein ACO1KR_13625 [Staphylococcus aureus]